jgi:hypothetical protein
VETLSRQYDNQLFGKTALKKKSVTATRIIKIFSRSRHRILPCVKNEIHFVFEPVSGAGCNNIYNGIRCAN